MKSEIETLKSHFGTYRSVAQQLGITERHLRNIRDGVFKPSKHLKKLIYLVYQQYTQSD